jgi:hypothetical protein
LSPEPPPREQKNARLRQLGLTSRPAKPEHWLVTRLGGERGVGLLLPLLFALGFMAASYSINARFIRLQAFGQNTMATIIKKNKILPQTDRLGGIRYEMTVGFTLDTTMRRGKVSVTGKYYDDHEAGERVPIRYLPDDPQTREIDPDRKGQFIKETMMIVALLVAIAVYNFFNLNPARRPETPDET